MTPLKKITPSKLALFAAIVCLPTFLLHFYPYSDFAHFYGPMIREFAAGHYDDAYHPGRPPLLPTLAGLITIPSGLDAYSAGKLVAILFFSLTVFPLYHLHKNIFGRRIAVVACVLFILCTRIMRYASGGQLASSKIFFLVCLAWALSAMATRPHWIKAVILGLAAAGITLARAEGLPIAVLSVTALLTIEIWTNRKRKYRRLLPYHTAAAFAMFLLAISPWVLDEIKMTRYPVTDSRQIHHIRKSFEFIGLTTNRRGQMPPDMFTAVPNPGSQAAVRGRGQDDESALKFWRGIWHNVIIESYKGLYPEYLPLLILGLAISFRQKRWTTAKTCLVGGYFLHGVIILAMLGGTWTQKRYMIQALPLLLGWTAIGAIAVYDFLHFKIGRGTKTASFCKMGLAALVLTMLYRGNRKGFEDWRLLQVGESKESNAYLAGQWIRDDAARGKPNRKKTTASLNSTKLRYHSGADPIVMTYNPRISFFAGADLVSPRLYPQVSDMHNIIKLGKDKSVDYVVVDVNLLKKYPGIMFKPQWKAEYEEVCVFGNEYPVRVFKQRDTNKDR